MVYIYLFFTALIAATLFPAGSEALLIYDITEGHSLALLLFVATLGNSLGSLINYYLGLKGESYLEEKKYLKKEKIEKYKKIFDKYGGYTLLLSWLPLVGDPITFIAGILKYDVKKFIPIVVI
ncbi:MAG: DedA family protein, partial [Campylobacteraceae bacterium]|nr:DedA family protein [Campylobacteraceae bacterium]